MEVQPRRLYYAWRKRPEPVRKREKKALISQVREIHAQKREIHGASRIADKLCNHGVDSR
jgi:hypothetical protein